MGPTGVVGADPLSDDTRGVLLGFKAMMMDALLFQRLDDAFDHAVLLRAVRRDELLPKTITTHEARISPRREHQPVVRPQQERCRNASQRPEPHDQRLLERRHRRRCSAASRELPAKEFSRVTVDHESLGLPAITARPDAAQIRCPAFVRRRCHRWQRLDAGSMPDGSLANLPARKSTESLYRDRVELRRTRQGL